MNLHYFCSNLEFDSIRLYSYESVLKRPSFVFWELKISLKCEFNLIFIIYICIFFCWLTTSALISDFLPQPIIFGFLSPGKMMVVLFPVENDEPDTQLPLSGVAATLVSVRGYATLELLLLFVARNWPVYANNVSNNQLVSWIVCVIRTKRVK